MITPRLSSLLEQHCKPLTNREERDATKRILRELGVREDSVLLEVYCRYHCYSIFDTKWGVDPDRRLRRELDDVLSVTADGRNLIDEPAIETPIGSTTAWLFDQWELPFDYLCLTQTDGTLYLYRCETEEVHHTTVDQVDSIRNLQTPATFTVFKKFLMWQLGVSD